ncbi:hypothetical protein JCM16303_004075 [Sporobolomyces ruberrimus]
MSVNKSIPRLPDEIAIEIFRNRVLTPLDLANCALASRRWVEPVRELLYESIKVVVMEDLGSSVEDEDSDEQQEEEDVLEMAYSNATWRLLRSLLENKEFGKLVRELKVSFEQNYDSRHYPDHSAVATTPSQALSTFLCLAPKTTQVTLKGHHPDTVDTLRKLARYKNIEGLSVRSAEYAEVDLIAEELGHLRRLEVWHLPKDRPTQLGSFPSNLDTLVLLGGRPESLLALLSPNTATLRSLTININAALDVTYSKFPQLSSLTLCCLLGKLDGAMENEVSTNHFKFWQSLCDSPSLVTLSFKSFNGSQNDHFSSIFSGSSAYPDKSIPTLRTIRFVDYTFLDRIQFLLSSPLAKTLHRVVLPWIWTREAAYGGEMKTRAVVGMCEKSGIQVCAGVEEMSFHYFL